MRFCPRVLPVLMERARHPTAINVIAITHICSRAYPKKKKGRVQLKSQGKRTDLSRAQSPAPCGPGSAYPGVFCL